ncbi:MAG: B12-binding domain-containing radical SAM protein [Spirochaetales bacterium]|nr:B12-binding domain-containing radical SAM protein [Spirochaetales bacterium]
MANLKILLISPGGAFLSRNDEFRTYMEGSREMKTILHYWNGLGAALPTVAGLTPDRHIVSICDENYETIDFSAPVDLVGLTGMTQQAPRAYEIADEFRRRGVYVAMGGIHATVLPVEALEHVDTVLTGEAENTWPQFLADFEGGKPLHRYDQKNYPDINLSTIPLPRYDLVAANNYPVVWVQATRGCPLDCDFCAATRIYGAAYRHKDADQVAREIVEVKKIWKHAQVGFADDNMFVNKKWVHNLLDQFEDIPFTWYAQSDISLAEHPDLLTRLHRNGLRILFVGFESVNHENLATINQNQWKARRLERYPESIAAIQGAGIGVYGSFIVGMEEDTTTVFDEIADFSNANSIMGTQVTILTPFPGSVLRNRLEEARRIVSSDWRLYTAWNCVITHPHLSAQEMEEGLLRIYRSVYSEEQLRSRAAYFKNAFRQLVGG